MSTKAQLESINTLAELERCGWGFEPLSDSEIKCRCPFHEDSTPSCCLNIKRNVFNCHTAGCRAKGDIVSFLARIVKQSRRVVMEDLRTRYHLEKVTEIESSVVEGYHAEIKKGGPLVVALTTRGLTPRVIRERRIGINRGRVTIPVYNEAGACVNVRRYLPGAPSSEKFKNMKGHGKLRLYPIDQLAYETIVVCGGELKALVVADRMNRFKIGAISTTGGEGSWEAEFSKRLTDKRIYICYDIDIEGEKGAEKIAAMVSGAATWVGCIKLPLDSDRYPHGDANDYFGVEEHTPDEFKELLTATKEYKPEWIDTRPKDEVPITVKLSEVFQPKNVEKRLRFSAIVSASDTTPYLVPRQVACTCEKNQSFCAMCPLFARNLISHPNMDIPPESEAILRMVANPKKGQREIIREGLHMPPCKSVAFKTISWYSVEDIRLAPKLGITESEVDALMVPALCVDLRVELNQGYEMTGRIYPNPKTQQSVLLLSHGTPLEDALSTYTPKAKELGPLRQFQPEAWTCGALAKKLNQLYADLSENVTQIYQRQDLHLAIDLAYHSSLFFAFDGKLVKGWVEILVAGDSSQGKSEATLQLRGHYGLGEIVGCKNATVAGLLGGLQQIGSRWFVTWGVIPNQDRRLVVLEELKGASTDTIGKLTDMRSTGIAELPKIEKRRTHARTRLLALSNPRGDRPLSSFSFGIEAVKELIGGLEDVRRFDFVLLVASNEIDQSEINRHRASRTKVRHAHTAELCRKCVLWAWTRSPEQVQFEDEAMKLILDEATKLCGEFTDVIPLVDRGSMRFKIARLAAALACRTFSCSDDMQTAIVRVCHVEYIATMIQRIYENPIFGYTDFSEAMRIQEQILDPKEITKRLLQLPFPADFIDQILHTNEIELRDLRDWSGWDSVEALSLLSLLVRKHALIRDGRSYRRNPAFIALLKELKGSKKLKAVEKPDYIKGEF